MINCVSCKPQAWKKNWIKYLFDWNRTLVSKELLSDKLINIKELLIKNALPNKFVENE